jgi:transcriptional regulator with XRE-family HTH domain
MKKITIEITIDEYIGRQIVDERKLRGWTQKELAKKLGWSSMTLSFFETGSRSMTPSRLYKIAKILNTEIDNLFP